MVFGITDNIENIWKWNNPWIRCELTGCVDIKCSTGPHLQSNNGNFGFTCSLNIVTMSLIMLTFCEQMYSWYCGQSLGEMPTIHLFRTKQRNSVPGWMSCHFLNTKYWLIVLLWLPFSLASLPFTSFVTKMGKLWHIKSSLQIPDALSNWYTSVMSLQHIVWPAVIQNASFGLCQFVLTNAEPPKSAMVVSINRLKPGNSG